MQPDGTATIKKIKEFSTGMRAKLKVLIALDHEAELLILDEPTVGLDVVAREEVLAMIREYMTAHEQAGVLISSHIATDLESLCDDLYLIRDGKIILHEDTDVLLSEYALFESTGKKSMRLWISSTFCAVKGKLRLRVSDRQETVLP